MLTTSSPIETRLLRIRERIEQACHACGRHPDSVRLVAVSKRQPLPRVEALAATGHRDFGENHVQAWADRQELLAQRATLSWHLIGPIQTNKARLISQGQPSLVHTIDRSKLVQALDRVWSVERPLDVLIQVNISEEPQKGGCLPHALPELIDRVTRAQHLRLRGLMCIPRPPSEGPPAPAFAALRRLGETLSITDGVELSMGMSQDFEIAIREGATIVRVGTSIFGARAS